MTKSEQIITHCNDRCGLITFTASISPMFSITVHGLTTARTKKALEAHK